MSSFASPGTVRRRAPAAAALLALVLAAALAGVPAAHAQQDEVVVTVNGEEIRYSDVALAEQELGGQLAGVPDEARFEYLVGLLIDRKLLSAKARAAGLDDDPEVARQVAFARERALSDVYLAREMEDAVSTEEARAQYDARVAEIELEEEVRARHILLDSEADAEAAIARLEAGEDFAALARELSTGPSGEEGGDLGYFTRDRMVAAFSEAAFALQPGAVSGPVESDFGWHVIKVEDRRMQQLVPFEEVEADIKAELRGEKARAAVDALREEAEIEFAGGERPQIVPPQ